MRCPFMATSLHHAGLTIFIKSQAVVFINISMRDSFYASARAAGHRAYQHEDNDKALRILRPAREVRRAEAGRAGYSQDIEERVPQRLYKAAVLIGDLMPIVTVAKATMPR